MCRIDVAKIKVIFEVGSRHGDESIALKKIFKYSQIYSFEPNPETREGCRAKLYTEDRIKFYPIGLGSQDSDLKFYPYTKGNPGASSFLLRSDAEQTQDTLVITCSVRTGESIICENGIDKVDLIYVDVQGYELEVLKGFHEHIHNTRSIVMKEPTPNPTPGFLDVGAYSKHIGAPSPIEIKEFMKRHGFKELIRIKENDIEDNVLYVNQGAV